MTIYQLSEDLAFPYPDEAEKDGFLAVGGDLSPERVLFALTIGVFPWSDSDDEIMWWAPDPRFVLFTENAKISKSLRHSCNKFNVKVNSNFDAVINRCSNIYRPTQDGTWITQGMIEAYKKLNEYGYAFSFESYYNEKLVGGLYGVNLGGIFIGESMFHEVRDAGKVAFCGLLSYCLDNGIKVIDCQIYSNLLESFGSCYISRKEYSELLKKYVVNPFVK